jgi:endo-1,4-beta-xylanase
VVLQRLKTHIEAVVGRYQGKVYAWDVVNEAIVDAPGETIYRNTNWYKIVGEEYVANAFEYAHAADPDALLFYNDYNTIFPGKRERIFQLVKGLLDKGVPIHGIGMQGHWSVTTPIAAELENTITKFASLGLTVQLTELDISIHDKGESRRELTASDTTTFTAEKEQKQADQYALIMEILRKNKKNISGVTFWNISDRHSWLDNFPVKGRKDYPLLFDQNLQPKKAYWRVVDF